MNDTTHLNEVALNHAMSSPAHTQKSRKTGTFGYPKQFKGLVPKIIQVKKDAYPCINRGNGYAVNGEYYYAWVNSYGAVSAIFRDGSTLGLLPSEFDVFEYWEANFNGITKEGNQILSSATFKTNVPKSKHYTCIQSFEVVEPTNQMEMPGEILHLSNFGEYCPDNSLRGYSLEYLLAFPANYRVNVIIQKGQAIKLTYPKINLNPNKQ